MAHVNITASFCLLTLECFKHNNPLLIKCSQCSCSSVWICIDKVPCPLYQPVNPVLNHTLTPKIFLSDVDGANLCADVSLHVG